MDRPARWDVDGNSGGVGGGRALVMAIVNHVKKTVMGRPGEVEVGKTLLDQLPPPQVAADATLDGTEVRDVSEMLA